MKQPILLGMWKTVLLMGLIMSLGTPSRAPAAGIVGNGTPASCTESALDTALSGGGAVTFNCGAGEVTINVTETKSIAVDTAIDGGGVVTLDAGYAVGVFAVNGVTFTVERLTIARGYTNLPKGGGGILNDGGSVTVRNSTLTENIAIWNGGGISNWGGTLTVTNSTFSENAGMGQGYGGGAIANAGALTVANSTFYGNIGAGAGIRNIELDTLPVPIATITSSTFFNVWDATIDNSLGGSGTVTLSNSIVATDPLYLNCGGMVIDGGHNLQFPDATCGASIPSVDPLLDPAGLASNGGTTQTIALLPASPAANAGDDTVCAAPPVGGVDQRGFTRPGVGQTHCSIGAFELNGGGPTPAATSTPTNTSAPGSATTTHTSTPTQPSSSTPTGTVAATPSATTSVVGTPTATPTGNPMPCVGDCSGTNMVRIADLILGVNITLGSRPPSACPAFQNSEGEVTIAQLIRGVNNALNGCG